MNENDGGGRLAAAMARAQAKFRHAEKKADNPAHRSRYADLAAVIDAIREPLGAEGLWFSQPVEITDAGFVVVPTIIRHASGETESAGTIRLRPMGDGPQAVGSAISYARRYGLAAAFGIAAAGDDDDGERAEGRGGSAPKPLTVVPLKDAAEDPKPVGIRATLDTEPPKAPATGTTLDPAAAKDALGRTPRRTTAEKAWGDLAVLAALQTDPGKRLAMLQGAYKGTKLTTPPMPTDLDGFSALDKASMCLVYGVLRDGLAKFAGFVDPPDAPVEAAPADTKKPDTDAAKGKGGRRTALPPADERKAAEMAAAATGDPVDSFLDELAKDGAK